MPQQQEQEIILRKGREGGRWINERPTPEEFGKWFAENMKIDERLDVEHYVGGVVLIPAVDTKAKYVTGFTGQGIPIIADREELSYIPYAKVEARIDYFWDLMEAREADRVGVVERVTPPRLPIDFVHTEEDEMKGESVGHIRRKIRTPSALTVLAHSLPDGFSIATIPVGSGYTYFLLCTTRVAIYRREDYEAKGDKAVPLRKGEGTKQVPLLLGRNTVYADSSSIMKAETGSLGRALGFAGIFVIPGSGIATAEDMLEALSQGTAPAEAPSNAQGPAAPNEAPVRAGAEQAVDEETEMRRKAVALYNALQEEHPEKHTEFTEWARGRRLRSLNDAKGAMLRGVLRTLERMTDEAEASAQQGTPVEATTESALPPETGESDSAAQPTEEAPDVSGEKTQKSANREENDAEPR